MRFLSTANKSWLKSIGTDENLVYQYLKRLVKRRLFPKGAVSWFKYPVQKCVKFEWCLENSLWSIYVMVYTYNKSTTSFSMIYKVYLKLNKLYYQKTSYSRLIYWKLYFPCILKIIVLGFLHIWKLFILHCLKKRS